MFKRALCTVATVIALAGCSGEGEPEQQPSAPPATASTGAFTGTVSLKDFSATCREVRCWLPTQFKAELVAGETVSLRDAWPMEGDEVLVLCETTGGSYRDASGQEVSAWYGIQIPEQYLEPAAADRAEKVGAANDRRGYVGAAWITGGSGRQAPRC